MTDDLNSIPWNAPEPRVQLARPRRCRRHEWTLDEKSVTLELAGNPWYYCSRCGKQKDPVASKRGKNNRARGNSIEREIAKRLGLRRVGQFGGPDDVAGDNFVAQVKSGGSFPERIWRWLKAVPVNATQTPLVVVTDAPGPGNKRRALVILTLEDWCALHVGTEEDAA